MSNSVDEKPTESFREFGDSAPVDVEDEIVTKFLGVSEDARESEKSDKEMSFMEAVRTYPKCAGWSFIFSSGLIMEGYDTKLLSSMYALPSFCKRFGTWDESSGSYQLVSSKQTGLNVCVSLGEIIGLQFAGTIADRIGTRMTLVGSLGLITCYIFLFFFAKNYAMLVVGQLLCGMPWGCFQTLATTYASEICPMVLRYYLTSYVNVAWVLGQLVGAGVMKNSDSRLMNKESGWKLPFGLMWIWPLPLAIGIYLAPESPWWLVKRGRLADAGKSVKRLLSGMTEEKKDIVADLMVKKMKMTSEKEKEIEKLSTYLECFKKRNFRRTRIACITFVIQCAGGSTLVGYSTYFYEKAGVSSSWSFNFTIIQDCLGFIGNIISWFMSPKVGRATMFIGGVGIHIILMLVIGIIGFVGHGSGSGYAVGVLLMVFDFVYYVTVGPVTYCIVPEIPSVKLRNKTVVLARNCYNVVGIVNGVLTPYMLNQWSWGARTGIYWAAFDVIWFVWSIFELPETKDRTFAEIDELFEEGVPSRKFRYTVVDPFENKKLLEHFDSDHVNRLANIEVNEKSKDIIDA
ncbi:hypothetical protein FOA43_001942 [Brettanomyces nanus]|uniref:Major facilitator superfamily (MFS) profile domain-containing protein n=1 Tax=Eeniella nana TaxID=13502 RepID=A0A875RP58_EENNA|nr:uncharacterized protein FOA43_001942 [Brettanomyces nanus]QPG74610.1 hypothetical protein FOA43_001942 [Brettanomyces nanus]